MFEENLIRRNHISRYYFLKFCQVGNNPAIFTGSDPGREASMVACDNWLCSAESEFLYLLLKPLCAKLSTIRVDYVKVLSDKSFYYQSTIPFCSPTDLNINQLGLQIFRNSFTIIEIEIEIEIEIKQIEGREDGVVSCFPERCESL